MSAIDIGSGATDRATILSSRTAIDLANPANLTGKITSIELWFNTDATGVKVGTFFGSGTDYTSRDVAVIGNVSSGSKQTFAELNIDVVAGDFIGIYFATGYIEFALSGASGVYSKQGDQFGTGLQTYVLEGAETAISAYGIGITPLTVTSQAVSSISYATATGNGNITDTGSVNPTIRGVCWSTGANPILPAGNYVSNPGFESGATAPGDSWNNDSANVSFSTSFKHSGARSLLAQWSNSGDNRGVYTNPITVPTAASTGYVEVYGQNTGSNPDRVAIRVWDATNSVWLTLGAATYITGPAGGATSFTKFGTTVTKTAGCISIQVYVTRLAADSANGGACYIDDVFFSPDAVVQSDGYIEEAGSFSTGAFTAAITGLTGYTTYHARAHATNSAGTSYGSDVSFTTLLSPTQAAGRYFKCLVEGIVTTSDRGYKLPTPYVTTDPLSPWVPSATTVIGNGTIVSVSLSNCTRRGFCYIAGTTGDPTTADSIQYDNGTFTAGAFTKLLTGLSAGTNYRIRAYAVNTEGTGYGSACTVLTKPAAPTNVAATQTLSGQVTVSWTNSPGATDHRVWRDTVDLGSAGLLGALSDTGASAPSVTPGAAVASDGTSTAHVALSLSGNSVADGTHHNYKVVASNSSGNSADSATVVGYRKITAPSYQWQRSQADSDANYASISGGTTAAYNDAEAPAHL